MAARHFISFCQLQIVVEAQSHCLKRRRVDDSQAHKLMGHFVAQAAYFRITGGKREGWKRKNAGDYSRNNCGAVHVISQPQVDVEEITVDTQQRYAITSATIRVVE
jgi:hypothetical protein